MRVSLRVRVRTNSDVILLYMYHSLSFSERSILFLSNTMSTQQLSCLFRLKAALQLYDWGKQGKDSLVAKLASSAIGPTFSLDCKTFYAEVQFYSSCPSDYVQHPYSFDP